MSNSEFSVREASVIVGNKEFEYPNYEIQFRMDFDKKGGVPSVAVIEIYNLSPETMGGGKS